MKMVVFIQIFFIFQDELKMDDIIPPISYSSSEDEFFDATSGGMKIALTNLLN